MIEDSQQAPPWLDVAQAQLGVKEAPGAASNPEVLKYYRATTLGGKPDDSIPWCSAFANWCMEKAGYRGTRKANARSWLDWGEHLEEPRLGCVVVLWRGDMQSSQGHVAFYFAARGKDKIVLLGGNQADRVCYSQYGVGRVLEYRWPSDAEQLR